MESTCIREPVITKRLAETVTRERDRDMLSSELSNTAWRKRSRQRNNAGELKNNTDDLKNLPGKVNRPKNTNINNQLLINCTGSVAGPAL